MELLRRIGAAFGRRGVPQGMEERVPPGQYVTPKMPVMSASPTPRVRLAEWRLSLYGEVERETRLTWDDWLSLAEDGVALTADFHCVTQWSRLNVGWEGVPASEVLDLARPRETARFAMLHCADGYTANLDMAAMRAPDALFAHRQDGAPLAPEHGGPLRLVVPSRYGWKSAKWVTGVEFLREDSPGFWERLGYHMRGDPWREERFAAR